MQDPSSETRNSQGVHSPALGVLSRRLQIAQGRYYLWTLDPKIGTIFRLWTPKWVLFVYLKSWGFVVRCYYIKQSESPTPRMKGAFLPKGSEPPP